jgi:hypothetical protein
MKVVWILLWLPIAAVLYLIFRPELHPSLLEVAVFGVAIWGAFLVRTMALSILGMITFWTTRVGALYELYFALELVLSGRMVPMGLMPEWVQRVAWLMPFQWTFFFPINALVGEMPQELLTGLHAGGLDYSRRRWSTDVEGGHQAPRRWGTEINFKLPSCSHRRPERLQYRVNFSCRSAVDDRRGWGWWAGAGFRAPTTWRAGRARSCWQ